jgi:hypothetical protein
VAGTASKPTAQSVRSSFITNTPDSSLTFGTVDRKSRSQSNWVMWGEFLMQYAQARTVLTMFRIAADLLYFGLR